MSEAILEALCVLVFSARRNGVPLSVREVGLGDDADFAATMTAALAGKQAALGFTPLNKAGDTLAGGMNFADYLLKRPYLQDYSEAATDLGNITGAMSLDMEQGNYFFGTLTGDASLSFSNPPASGRLGSFTLDVVNGGAHTITWPAGVSWGSAGAPALSAAAMDTLVFKTRDAGTHWQGYLSGAGF
jgi:hypothetical protein